MALAPYQQRVFDEYHELAVKVDKLNVFLESPQAETVNGEPRHLLESQLHWMRGYKMTLERRLQLFKDQ